MSLQMPRILVVDDEPEILKAIERTVRGRFEMVGVETPAKALDEILKSDFQVVISDQRMPGKVGTELLAEIAKKKPLVTRVILTAHTDTKEILEAINRAEIFRYILKPWDNQEFITQVQQAVDHHQLLKRNRELILELREKNEKLVSKEQELLELNKNLEHKVEERTTELKLANERLSEQAMTDPLTKVLNRRAFFHKFNEEIDRASRYKRPLILAMIDVDHFKHFNDTEGHVFGDEALRKIAQLFATNIRKSDAVGRYGGEEFILIMPETKIAPGKDILERLRNRIEQTSFQGQRQEAYLTVSIGLAAYPEDGASSEALVQAADQALYAAKQSGRNQVVYERSHGSFFVSR